MFLRLESAADLPQGRQLYWGGMGNGTLLVNMMRVKGNGAKIEDINYAEKEELRQVFSVAHYLQRNNHGNYILSHVPGQIGVRETNQIYLRDRHPQSDRRSEHGRTQAGRLRYSVPLHASRERRRVDRGRPQHFRHSCRHVLHARSGDLLCPGSGGRYRGFFGHRRRRAPRERPHPEAAPEARGPRRRIRQAGRIERISRRIIASAGLCLSIQQSAEQSFQILDLGQPVHRHPAVRG